MEFLYDTRTNSDSLPTLTPIPLTKVKFHYEKHLPNQFGSKKISQSRRRLSLVFLVARLIVPTLWGFKEADAMFSRQWLTQLPRSVNRPFQKIGLSRPTKIIQLEARDA